MTPSERIEIDLLGEFLMGLREFSLFLTRTIELAQHEEFASNNDLLVLIALHLDGPQRPRQLAAGAGLSSGGISLLLDRLQSSGWIRRRRGAVEDGRAVVVELTEHGTAAVERTGAATTAAFAAARPLLERLRDQLEQLGFSVPPEAVFAPRDLATLRRLVDAGHLMYAAMAEVTGSYEDATNTFHVLWLARREAGIRPVSISAATGLSSAGTADLLDRLETDRLVQRSSCGHPDGRAVVVTATTKGRRTLDESIASTRPILGLVTEALFAP